MFHRRKTSNPPRNTPPSPSAALAATQAFQKSQGPNASLSASAAAAALRSHTPPPTNPADLQTKRMVRRGSTSSRGSDARSISPRRPSHQRTNSNGSMTERSFRSPSPNRAGSVHVDPNAPPVPALPSVLKQGGTPHRRAASVEPQPSRMASPPPRVPGGRVVSVDATERVPDRRVVSMSQFDSGNGRSINFSRPMSPAASPHQNSPTAQKSSPASAGKAGRSGWFTAPVDVGSRMRQDINDVVKPVRAPSAIQTHQTQQTVRNAAERPVSRHKDVGHALPPQGSRLSKAVKGMESSKYAVKYDPNTRTIQRVPTDIESEPEITTSLATKAQKGTSPTIEPPVISSSLAEKTDSGTSPTLAKTRPVDTRQAGTLGKRPSIVREEQEEEDEQEEAQFQPKEHIRGAFSIVEQQPAKSGETHSRSVSLQPNEWRAGRRTSPSPSRQAHFADAPILLSNGFRHDPPARSLSPAKPALRHSPGSSIRTASPIAHANQDMFLLAGDEGKRPGGKKSARVSFGEEAEIIPEQSSPSGLDASRFAAPAAFDDDSDFEMSPRPELPSFGSIRGRARQTQPAEPVVKVTETVPSSVSTSVSTLPPLEHSSDHAVGGILKDADASRKGVIDSNEPLPPEVTSVEGTGYISDSESSDEEGAIGLREAALSPVLEVETPMEDSAPAIPAEPQGAKGMTQRAPTDGNASGSIAAIVPDIAVEPATPGAAEETATDEWAFVMPGGFAGSWDEDEVTPQATQYQEQPKPTSTTTSNEPARPRPAPAVVPSTIPDTVHEESSDNDSIYSDAEEELSDHEKFASIDAVVDSPVAASPIVNPATGSHKVPSKAARASSQPADWDKTKAYWSSLSKQQKEELERQAEADRASQAAEASHVPPQKQKKKTTSVAPATPIEAAAQEPKKQRRHKQPQEGRAAPRRTEFREDPPSPPEEFRLRKSMRGPQPDPDRPATHMRQSLRSGAMQSSVHGLSPESERVGIHMRQSMRTGAKEPSTRDGPGRGLAASRFAQPPPTTKGALQKKHIPTTAARPATAGAATASASSKPPAMPLLLRNDSSGSDSSFKRMRPSSIASDGGRFTMRRTLRGTPGSGASENVPQQPRRASPSPPARTGTSTGGTSKRFSLRSLSPPARRRQPRLSVDSSVGQRPQSMASTLRDTSSRSSKSPTRFSLLGRSKDAKGTSPVSESGKPSRPAFRSRFSVDSDGDSPVARIKFKSRFADSDDEEDSPVAPQNLTPVRGIPRKPGEEDRESTDLEGEDDDELGQLSSSKDPAKTPATDGKAAGSALAAGSMRGLASSKYASDAANAPSPSGQSAQSSKKEKRSLFGLGPRKKHMSLASSAQRSSIDSSNVDTASPSQPRSPKLQRRNTPQSAARLASDTWPLPPPPKMRHIDDDEDGRPNTSDGAPAGNRPSIGNRRSTVDGSTPPKAPARNLRFDESSIVGTADGEGGGLGRKGSGGEKKKRFGMLRKAFKLND